MRELQALRAECERAEATLRAVPGDAWDLPGLGEWNLHALAAHLTRAMGRLAVYLDQPVEGEPVKNRVSYFRYDADAIAPGAAARAVDEAKALPPEQLAATFAEVWRDSMTRASAVPGDRVMFTPFGAMHVQEYSATRVLEAVVHHMDVRRALDLSPDPEPEAAELVVELLEGLLDGPRPRNLGRDRFILVCTGRIAHDDPRFPVLR